MVPPIEGIDLNQIYTLWSVEDALAIKDFLSRGKVKKVTIVGAGLIGVEMIDAFDRWETEVTVIEMLDWVLPKIVDRDYCQHE